jgi:hypothetical protein
LICSNCLFEQESRKLTKSKGNQETACWPPDLLIFVFVVVATPACCSAVWDSWCIGRLRAALTLGLGIALGAAISHAAQPPAKGRVCRRDLEVMKTEPGTHSGGGETVYQFFAKTPNLKMVFREAALKPGFGHRLPRAEGGRDLLRAERPRRDDDRRQEPRSPQHRRPPARQFAWAEAGRPDDLVIMINYEQALRPRRSARHIGGPPAGQMRDDPEHPLVTISCARCNSYLRRKRISKRVFSDGWHRRRKATFCSSCAPQASRNDAELRSALLEGDTMADF